MFSTSWKSSKKPGKQVKYRETSPLHIKAKFMHTHLSKDLANKHGTRSLRARKGDRVSVVKGQFKGKSAKIERVDMKNSKVYLEGIDIQKGDGTKVKFPISVNNVMIIELIDDKRRFKRK
jgi:large subunit ribosomal protein L24